MTESVTVKERRTEDTLADDIRSARAELRAELRSARAKSAHFKALNERYWKTRKRYAAFESGLSKKHPALKGLLGGVQRPHWEQARRSLPGPDAAFMEFLVSQDSVRVFIFRRCSGDQSRHETCPELKTYS